MQNTRIGNLLCIGVVLLLLVLSSPLLAQKEVITQDVLWVRYQLGVKIGNGYRIRHEFEERAYWFPWRQHQFLSRTHLSKPLGEKWSGALGFTYFLQSLPHAPRVEDYSTRTELRPQIELASRQTLSPKWGLIHRYWFEFRYFEQDEGGFDYGNTRFRYKLGVRYAVSPKFHVKAFDELFINIGGSILRNVFDQNRYGLSVQYLMSPHTSMELGYFNWYQQRATGDDFFNRHIIRFTFFHNIDARKRNKSE